MGVWEGLPVNGGRGCGLWEGLVRLWEGLLGQWEGLWGCGRGCGVVGGLTGQWEGLWGCGGAVAALHKHELDYRPSGMWQHQCQQQ